MDVDEAHELYQQFQKVDAAAKQKQGLGFGVAAPQARQTNLKAAEEVWAAPYKLADKFQQQQASPSRKRNRDHTDTERPHKSVQDNDQTSSKLGRHSSKPEVQRAKPDNNSRYVESRSKHRRLSPDCRRSSHSRHGEDRHRLKSSQSQRSKDRHSESDSDLDAKHSGVSRSPKLSQCHKHHESSHASSRRHDSNRGHETSRHHNSSRHHESSRHHGSGRHHESDRQHDSDRHQPLSRNRHSSRHYESSKDRDSSRDYRSSNRSSDGKASRHHSSDRRAGASHKERRNSKQHEASKPPDYSRLIVGYDDMTLAERLRAVTKHKLKKTSSKDAPAADGKPWTRFVFNNEALLEEEGARPDSFEQEGKPAGLGAFDFRPHTTANIADTGRSAEQAHEAAIFGLPATMSEAREPQNGMQLLAEDEEAPQIVPAAELQFCTDPSAPDQNGGSSSGLASNSQEDAVRPPEAKLSWREKALLKKQQTSQA